VPNGCVTVSIQVHELVQVEQRPAQLRQRRVAEERRGPLPFRRCRRPPEGQPVGPLDALRLRRRFLRQVVGQRLRGGGRLGGVEQGQRLRGGRAPLPAGAAQVAVRQVERLQERVPQVPPGEQV